MFFSQLPHNKPFESTISNMGLQTGNKSGGLIMETLGTSEHDQGVLATSPINRRTGHGSNLVSTLTGEPWILEEVAKEALTETCITTGPDRNFHIHTVGISTVSCSTPSSTSFVKGRSPLCLSLHRCNRFVFGLCSLSKIAIASNKKKARRCRNLALSSFDFESIMN